MYSFLICSFVCLSDAQACTRNQIRLFNGSSSSNGVLQVCNSSRIWTDVCDYYWNNNAHSVIVCKQLGFTSPSKAIHCSRHHSKCSFYSSYNFIECWPCINWKIYICEHIELLQHQQQCDNKLSDYFVISASV